MLQQQKNLRKSATATTMWAVLMALMISVLYSCKNSDADERVAYDNIVRFENENKLDSLGEALEDYFDTYDSDACHFAQLKDLNDRFFNEHADWETTQSSLSLDGIQQFLDDHPDGFYLHLARHQFDSLSYVKALDANTVEAYEQYLNQFPQGAFMAKARKKLNDLENMDLPESEKEKVIETLTNHFKALADNDREAIAATMASHPNSYLGKTDPELEDIYAYMSTVHSSSRILIFTLKDVKATKAEAVGRNIYNVQFSLKEDAYTHAQYEAQKKAEANDDEEDSATPTSTKHFTGAAVLDEGMKITSLVLRQ